MIFLVSSRRAEMVALSSSFTENFLEIRRALNLNSLIKLKNSCHEVSIKLFNHKEKLNLHWQYLHKVVSLNL